MAASSHDLTPLEQSQFATTLYHSIWREFGITAAGPVEAGGSTYPGTCRQDIHKAVICEQLLMRDFMRNYFFQVKTVPLIENVDSVVSFCNSMHTSTLLNWNYFKRFLRCTAFIAEYFLLRPCMGLNLELQKAPAIWCQVFRENFAGRFGVNRGFEGLNTHSELYIDQLYDSLRGAFSRMESPQDGVHPSILQNIPLMEEHETDPNNVYREMYDAVEFVDASRSPGSTGTSSPSSQNGRGSVQPRSPSLTPRGVKSPRLDPGFLNATICRMQEMMSPNLDTLRVPVHSTVEVFVTPPSPQRSPHVISPVNPTADPVISVINPADSDKDPQVTAKPDDAVASTSKASEDSPPKQSESPESRSKKRSSVVLETPDDSPPPSPKQPKPSE